MANTEELQKLVKKYEKLGKDIEELADEKESVEGKLEKAEERFKRVSADGFLQEDTEAEATEVEKHKKRITEIEKRELDTEGKRKQMKSQLSDAVQKVANPLQKALVEARKREISRMLALAGPAGDLVKSAVTAVTEREKVEQERDRLLNLVSRIAGLNGKQRLKHRLQERFPVPSPPVVGTKHSHKELEHYKACLDLYRVAKSLR